MAASVKRALFVGGTAGIGYSIACRVASLAKSSVITIGGRTAPKQVPYDNIHFRAIDATSMSGIKKFTDEYKAEPGNLDLLVVSQGTLTMEGRSETEEGIDRKMALHYYGRQLLIRELTPIMSPDAKVLIVLDSINGGPSKLNYDDLDLKKTFTLGHAADHCLSMNDAMVQVHAAAQSQTSNKRHFVHAYPGFVKTNLGRKLPWGVRHLANGLASVLAVTPEACAEYLLDGAYAAAADGEKEGRYYSYINDKGKVCER